MGEHCPVRAPGGGHAPHAKAAEFFTKAGKDLDMTQGRALSLHEVNAPQNVHYPTWEMHPPGDELLIVASGALSVEFRNGGTIRTAHSSPRSAFVVPAGSWHRLMVNEPSVLLAITPPHNTVHEKA